MMSLHLRDRLAHHIPHRFHHLLPGRKYRYNPLNRERKEIRLLRLDRKSLDAKDEPIRCDVEHMFLDDHEPPQTFAAISYCWTSNPGEAKIVLDGKKVTVPGSAEAAIRGTYRSDEQNGLPIWIDAICINQMDVEEKSHQVALMGELYSKAAKTLIWLGKDAEGIATTAFKSIQNFLDWAPRQNKIERNMPSGQTLQATNPTRARGVSPARQELVSPFFEWDAVACFASAPWFRRLWAMQEVFLAKDALCESGEKNRMGGMFL
jgi:hypothetical protein